MGMIKLLITADQWAGFDQWSNFTLPGVFIVGGLIVLFVGIIPFAYKKNKITKSLFLISIILIICFASFAYIKNKGMKDYYAENKYITPQSRTYQLQMFSKRYYETSEVQAWEYEDDWQSLSKLESIYRRIPVKQQVTYLGRKNSYVYIKINKQIIRFYESDCQTTATNKSYITGYKFLMRDKSFRQIGFIEQPYYFEKLILIPKAKWNKQADDTVVRSYTTPGLAGNWLTEARK
ncbi:hypothetical protein J2Z60_000744 [Lactobacillus colini]|uniref:Uncharacterized protein n=1 Tax=Lactobacillus colini TaxID=1819254 RepID=A0ABS4MD10_9LACO|nr:hypothetical protein [Lactobacillus colini]MBP2057573.1 hypothetical protein [Lactobacillus colini]